MKLWKAALIPAGVCALTYLTVHGRKDHPGWETFERVRFAHRGLYGPGVPENSLAAFRRAAEAGCTGAAEDLRALEADADAPQARKKGLLGRLFGS